jgi:hypothetical protein
MKINTKFDIGDIVQLKYEFSDADHKKMAYEIMAITSESSYGGAEIHYYCRSLHLIGIQNEDKSRIIGWELRRGYRANVQNDNQLGTNKFIETELVEAGRQVKEIINRKIR